MLTTKVSAIGGTLIHWPSLVRTCRPPTESCQRKVKDCRSVCAPRPTSIEASAGSSFLGSGGSQEEETEPSE